MHSRSFCILLFLIGAFWMSAAALALDPRKAITQYQQDFWTEEDGLPQASVQSITQTRNGYIWIGTRDGLARFDGTKFTVFRGEEFSGLQSDDVRSLYEDRSGRLWIGTFNGGVSCFENGTFRGYSTRDGLTSSGVLTVFEDSTGAHWFGAWEGILRMENGKFTSFRAADGLIGLNGWALWEDSKKIIWAATDRGLHNFKGGRFHPNNYTGAQPQDIRSVFVDRKGLLWIGTLNGLLRIENGEAKRLDEKDGLADMRVRAIADDADGNVWVGTWSGLSRIQGDKITSPPLISGERLNGMVEALFVDRDGSLWFGVRGGGLGRLRDARFSNLTTREGLPSNLLRAVFPARDGAVWIGTDGGGLARLKGSEVQVIDQKAGLPSDFVASVAEAADGTIWAGLGRPAAIAAIRNGKVERVLGEEDGLPFEYSVRAVFVDRSGVLWAGGDAGLCNFPGGELRQIQGIPGRPVRIVTQDHEGKIWAGSNGGLCLVRDGKVASAFSVRDGLSHNAVYSIFEDKAGALWLGTQQGLTRYKFGKFQSLSRSKGGFQGTIYYVTEDGDGRIWISTSRGISSAPKAEIEAALDGAAPSVEWANFDTADGLKSSQGQGGSQSPGCRTSDGRLWFATLNGVAIVTPGEKDPHRGPPPVLLEEMRANRIAFATSANNIFAPDTDDFEFHYTALKFITPERAQFRYQLVGHDKEWVYAKSRRAAYYNNLRPGTFKFRVAASSDGVVWSQPAETAPFRLRPHFYQTSWFYLLCLAAAGLSAWSFHRYRLLQTEEQFALVLAERTRIARDLHDTLAQGFAGTAFQLEALRNKIVGAPPETKRHLDLALTMVRHSFTEAKRAVLNLRSPDLDDSDLVTAVSKGAAQILGGAGVEWTVRTVGKPKRLDADMESQLLRICQEAMANVVKHAKATRVEIDFDFSQGRPAVSIRDNGQGFDLAHPREGGLHFGIQGMNERMKQVGGVLEIKSAPGRGSEILIRLN